VSASYGNCPRCKYPGHECRGGPYLGLYDADRPCDNCGYKTGDSRRLPKPEPLYEGLHQMANAFGRWLLAKKPKG